MHSLTSNETLKTEQTVSMHKNIYLYSKYYKQPQNHTILGGKI